MPINSTESLSRYFCGRVNNFLTKNNEVKWTAFKPKNNETSVFATSELSENEIWDIGEQVAITSDRDLSGRAEILAGEVREINLDVIESVPPPRHANIIGWPGDEAEIKQLALELSEAAQGYKR